MRPGAPVCSGAPRAEVDHDQQADDDRIGRDGHTLVVATGARLNAYHVTQVVGVRSKMRLNSKGQVTIPAQLRERHGLHVGDELDVVDEAGALRIVRTPGSESRGERIVQRMRGRANTTMSTDQLLRLLRDE